MKNPLSKIIGSILIIIGTEIGAGILALPIVSAQVGFPSAVLIMLIAWFVMTYTSVLIADICIKMPYGTSFGSMARSTLGIPGAMISWASFIILLYSVCVAYISAATSAFTHLFPVIPIPICSILFVIIFATIVACGVRSVDLINRFLLTIKLILLAIVCISLLTWSSLSNLLIPPVSITSINIAIPVIVTSFTSHLIVPTITDYLKKDSKDIFKVLIIGSIIPLIVYLIWLTCILGTLPLDGPISFMNNVFNSTNNNSANIGEVLTALSLKIKTNGISFFIDAFADISVMTSYLSVSLALFHFNKDSYGLKGLTYRKQNIISMLLTFAIPLIIVQYNPNLFISALSYSGVCIAILLVIMPAIITIKMLNSGHDFQYRISKMKPLLYTSIALGLCIIIIKLTTT